MDEDTFIPAPDAALRIEPLGDRALLVILGEGIDAQVNDRVHRLAAALRKRNFPGVQDIVPAYATLAVHYDLSKWVGHSAPPCRVLETEIRRLWRDRETGSLPDPRLLEISVCYGGEWGPDLREVAERCRLAEQTVVERHTAAEYRVFMLGFTPGFPYLGGLDPSIAVPRHEAPRVSVPAGSVGIAGMQTGIYPLESPGGWQIIGRTPRRLFDPGALNPCWLRPGDRLRFVAIDPDEFQRLLEDRR